MATAAANRTAPSDLCYLHNFDAPQNLWLCGCLPGQGRLLHQLLARLTKSLLTEIPQRLDGQELRVEIARYFERIRLMERSRTRSCTEKLTILLHLLILV